MIYLEDVNAGTRFHLESVPEADLRARLLRLGFLDGPVTCRTRIRKGPVVITRKGTELAIGKPVAKSITVTPVGEGADKDSGTPKRKQKRGDSKTDRIGGDSNAERSRGDGKQERDVKTKPNGGR